MISAHKIPQSYAPSPKRGPSTGTHGRAESYDIRLEMCLLQRAQKWKRPLPLRTSSASADDGTVGESVPLQSRNLQLLKQMQSLAPLCRILTSTKGCIHSEQGRWHLGDCLVFWGYWDFRVTGFGVLVIRVQGPSLTSSQRPSRATSMI